MTVIDIGANQGFYTLLAAGRIGPTGQVFAFEPAPPEFTKLKRNIRLNHYSNVCLEPSAVGSSDGYTEFHVCLDGVGSFSSRRLPAEDVQNARKQIIQAPLVSLDRYLADHEVAQVDFIKMDAEGGELDALQGITRTLNTFRPVILCELADTRTQPWGYRAAEIYRFLVSRDYRWYEATQNGWLSFAAPKEQYTQAENLIAVPEEKARRGLHRFLESSC